MYDTSNFRLWLTSKSRRFSVFNNHCDRNILIRNRINDTNDTTGLHLFWEDYNYTWMNAPPFPDFLHPESCLHGKETSKISKTEEKSVNCTYCISCTHKFCEFRILNSMSIYFQTRRLLKEKTMIDLDPKGWHVLLAFSTTVEQCGDQRGDMVPCKECMFLGTQDINRHEKRES